MGTVLVTGGAGFIGNAVARRLVDLGWSVVTADTAELSRVDVPDERWRHVVADVRDAGGSPSSSVIAPTWCTSPPSRRLRST